MFIFEKGENDVGASWSKRVFTVCNTIIMLLLSVTFLYPFWNTLVLSFNDSLDIMKGGIYLWPRMWTLDNYRAALQDSSILNAYGITIAKTVLGTFTSVLFTGSFAYALSKKKLIFRNFYLNICLITMFFSGGMVPTYLLYRWLGLLNNFWVYIIPGFYSIGNMLIMKAFFVGLPASLEEAAEIDGYNHLQIFFKIIIPTSMPVFATIALFNGVAHWNGWFDAYLYNEESLYPLQTLLRKIINQSEMITQMQKGEGFQSQDISVTATTGMVTSEGIKLATMMITIGPIILIYPFLQKYFVKGVMIGAVKE